MLCVQLIIKYISIMGYVLFSLQLYDNAMINAGLIVIDDPRFMVGRLTQLLEKAFEKHWCSLFTGFLLCNTNTLGINFELNQSINGTGHCENSRWTSLKYIWWIWTVVAMSTGIILCDIEHFCKIWSEQCERILWNE